jgi:hypothetical protein
MFLGLKVVPCSFKFLKGRVPRQAQATKHFYIKIPSLYYAEYIIVMYSLE